MVCCRMDDQPTCGQGLAAHSRLPAAVGDLIAAMAVVFDVHQRLERRLLSLLSGTVGDHEAMLEKMR